MCFRRGKLSELRAAASTECLVAVATKLSLREVRLGMTFAFWVKSSERGEFFWRIDFAPHQISEWNDSVRLRTSSSSSGLEKGTNELRCVWSLSPNQPSGRIMGRKGFRSDWSRSSSEGKSHTRASSAPNKSMNTTSWLLVNSRIFV